MYTIVLGLFIFVCILLILAVLIQPGKDGDLSSNLGGGSGSSFGPATPENMLNKITTMIASCFLILSLILTLMSINRKPESLIRGSDSGNNQVVEQQIENEPNNEN